MSKIDFGAVKLIPIGSVLSYYRVEPRKVSGYLICKCPLPTHNSKEPNSFKVSIEKNLWKCWSTSCRSGRKQGGDCIDLVCEMENLTPVEAARKLMEMFVLEDHVSKVQKTVESVTEKRNKPLRFTLPVNPEHPMIQGHGIAVETARDWGVGYYRCKQGTASMHQRIVFPLKEDGQLVGYLGRATRVDQAPVWKFGAQHKSFLFGLERCEPAHPVIITESCWAVLFFFERGQQAASMMGSDLTAEQETQLVPFEVVILGLDNDEKGKEAAAKIHDRLERNGKKVIRALLREG